MSAKVAFLEKHLEPKELKSRIAINPKSIITRNSKKTVFLIKENRVVETRITAGSQIGDMIEVISGLKAGERIVANPSRRLKSGTKIKVID